MIYKRIGEIHNTKYNGKVEIIEYINSKNITIKFIDDNTITYNNQYINIKSGLLKNPNKPSVFNIGYLGIGNYNKINSLKFYDLWQQMLRRCYDKKYHDKNITYIGCTVDERWYNFQTFAEWCKKNYIDGFVLDKDIISNTKDNKIYGPDTCCFIPQEISGLFTVKISGNLPTGVSKHGNNYQVSINIFDKLITFGTYQTIDEASKVYITEKKKHIINVANKWKNGISDKVYFSILNYDIENIIK